MNRALSCPRALQIGIVVGTVALIGGIAVAANAAGSESHSYQPTDRHLNVTGGRVDFTPATGAVTQEPMKATWSLVDPRTGEVVGESDEKVEITTNPPARR